MGSYWLCLSPLAEKSPPDQPKKLNLRTRRIAPDPQHTLRSWQESDWNRPLLSRARRSATSALQSSQGIVLRASLSPSAVRGSKNRGSSQILLSGLGHQHRHEDVPI